jgi:hypothetical protein
MDYEIPEQTRLYSQNDLWGIQTKRNKPVTPALYHVLIEIDEDHFLAKRWVKAKQQLLWGLLNGEGKQLIPFQYNSLEPHKQVFIAGQQQNNLMSYGLVSADGKIIVNTIYERIKWVSDNRFATAKGKKTTIIDASGNKIVQLTADSIRNMGSRVMQIWSGGKTGLITTEGELITDTKYAGIDKIDNKIFATAYPEWLVVNNKDTLHYFYHNVQIWHDKFVVTGNNRQWVVNRKDSALSISYQTVQPKNNLIAVVGDLNLLGSIKISGAEIAKPVFDQFRYQDGYFLAGTGKPNPSWSLIDTFGIVKTHFNYDAIRSPGEGLFPIKRRNKWGFINRYGIEVIPAIYDKVTDFKDGVARVVYFDEEGVIDHQGEWLLKPRNEKILWLGSDRYLGTSYGLYFLKDFSGTYIYFTNNELTMVNNLVHELDSNKNIIKRLSLAGTFVYHSDKYEPQYGESEGLAIIKKNNKYGFVDKNGMLRIAYRYDSVRLFSEGLAAMKINNHWGFIDNLEIIKIQPQYDKVSDFVDGHALIYSNDLAGVITQDGEVVIKPAYDNIQLTSCGYYIVQSGHKFGLLNRIGASILHPRYDYLEVIDNEMIIVKRRNRYGIMSLEGVSIVPMDYELIQYHKKSRSLLFKQPAPEPQLVYSFR